MFYQEPKDIKPLGSWISVCVIAIRPCNYSTEYKVEQGFDFSEMSSLQLAKVWSLCSTARNCNPYN